jgi:hypothetical protein
VKAFQQHGARIAAIRDRPGSSQGHMSGCVHFAKSTGGPTRSDGKSLHSYRTNVRFFGLKKETLGMDASGKGMVRDGFIFINVDPTPQGNPARTHLGELGRRLAGYPLA